MDVELALPLWWRVTLPTPTVSPLAPVIDGDRVYVRAGESVVAVDAVRREVAWTCALPPRSGSGTALARVGDLVVTTRVRPPDRLYSLVAIDRGGRVAWELPLDAVVAEGGLEVVNDREIRVVATAVGDHRGAALFMVDPQRGAVTARRRLPAGGGQSIARGDEILIRATPRQPDAPGLYRLDADEAMTPLVTGACWLARVAGDDLVTAVSTEDQHELAAWRHGVRRWSHPIAGGAADADATAVASVAPDGAVTLRDVTSGAARWSTAGDPEPVDELWLAGGHVVSRAGVATTFRRRKDGVVLGTTERDLGPPTTLADALVMAAGGELWCAAPG